jgi:hypothetical protein
MLIFIHEFNKFLSIIIKIVKIIHEYIQNLLLNCTPLYKGDTKFQLKNKYKRFWLKEILLKIFI